MKSLKYVDFGCEIYHIKTQDTHCLFICLIPRSSRVWKRTQGSHPAELLVCNSTHRCTLRPLPVTGACPVFLFSTHPSLLISRATLSMLNPAPTAFQTCHESPTLPFRQITPSSINCFSGGTILRSFSFLAYNPPPLVHFLTCSEELKTENIFLAVSTLNNGIEWISPSLPRPLYFCWYSHHMVALALFGDLIRPLGHTKHHVYWPLISWLVHVVAQLCLSVLWPRPSPPTPQQQGL